MKRPLLEIMLAEACATSLLEDRLSGLHATVTAGIHSAELAERLRWAISTTCRRRLRSDVAAMRSSGCETAPASQSR